MTNGPHQNKSTFLDLMQEQIFQRFRFGKQTKLDHSEELTRGFEMSNTQKPRFPCHVENNTTLDFLVSGSFQITVIQRAFSKKPKTIYQVFLAIRYSNNHLYSIYIALLVLPQT